MKNTLKRNTYIIMALITIVLWTGTGILVYKFWHRSHPVVSVQAKYPGSLVIIDRGDYGYIRFYHALDTLNYIYDHSMITKATLK